MTTESLLVKTKDNYVIVLSVSYTNNAEKLRLIKQCEHYCQNINFKDFKTSGIGSENVVYDVANTQFLRDEIIGYHYKKQPQNFKNEMRENNFPAKMNKPDVLHFVTGLPDTFFPEMIRNVGYHIKPEDEIFKVRYNSSKGKYEILDFKIKRAEVNYSKKEIKVVRNHFEFKSQDFEKLQKMIADYGVKKQKNPNLYLFEYAKGIKDSKDYSLFLIYAREQENINHLNATLDHELKHVKNMIFLDGLGLKDDYKLMSVDNMYRICVENERSAYLQQLVFCINKYLKNGDYNDFSMFDGESTACANYLKTLKTKEERLKYASNWPVLVDKMMEQFDSKHKAYYDNTQFAGNVMSLAETEPVSAPEDINNETFLKIRSLYYQYLIYNPLTGKDERVSLSKYILPSREVKISDEVRNKIINPAKEKLLKRRKNLDESLAKGEINPNFILPAKKLMRESLNSSLFINEIDGMYVGRILDEPKSPTINTTNVSKPVLKVPDDKAFWSDDLQKYWSKVDGYKEIAKNNYEYTFKIKTTKVTYKDKSHVDVGSNADFDLYVKLLKEPSCKNNVIKFANTLSKEQALMLYIACVNYGRQMSGAVPTDLSQIKNLKGIPPEEMNKFNHRTSYNVRTVQNVKLLTTRGSANLGR